MGTPIHPRDPDNLGETCTECEALVWGVGKTPKLIRIVFRHIIPTGSNPSPPNNLPITCEQVPAAPCNYDGWITFGGYDFKATYLSVTGLVTLSRINGGVFGYFWGYYTPCMAGPFPNDFPVGQGYAGGGSAYVLDLPLDYVLGLSDSLGFSALDRPLYDVTDTADPDIKSIRIASAPIPGSVESLVDITA